MGGYRAIVGSVKPFIEFLGVTVPVALHVDHGTYDEAVEAIEAGFSSVMFDGSALLFEENLRKTEEVVKLCRERGVSLECEVGGIGGEEDGVTMIGEFADPEECRQMAALGVDMLAAGIGNIHGVYPPDWPGLNFDLLEEISRVTDGLPLVLHGGSQIPEEMITRAISLGVRKINVNTECQLAFAEAIRSYFEHGKDRTNKGFSLRAMLTPEVEAVMSVAIQKDDALWQRRQSVSPTLAICNVRNQEWRVPPDVPVGTARASISQAVRQHVGHIQDELAKIGLINVPVIALSSQRALFARASLPYRGPHEEAFLSFRDKHGTKALERWSGYPRLEKLLVRTISEHSVSFRIGVLNSQLRGVFLELHSEIGKIENEAHLAADTLVKDRVGPLLRLLGYPPKSDASRRSPLRDGDRDQRLIMDPQNWTRKRLALSYT